MSCVLDFVWKCPFRREAVPLPRLNDAALHIGSVYDYWALTGQLLCSLRKQPAPWKTHRGCSCSQRYWSQPFGSSGSTSSKACVWFISGLDPMQCEIWPFWKISGATALRLDLRKLAICKGTKDIDLSWQVSRMRSVLCGTPQKTCWETVRKGCLWGNEFGWDLSFVAFNLEIAEPNNPLCSAY